MKRILSFALLIFVLLSALAACTPTETPGDDVTVRIAGMTGPTSMGLVKLAEDNANGLTEQKYEITTTYAKADEITPKLVNGELDMAALPANVAATLYGRTNGAIQVLAINTLGVVNIVEKGESIQDFSDLVGKKIYAIGRGTTPEYGLRYLLAENNVNYEDLTIEWKSAATEILPLLKTEENAVAMIPQPFATAAQLQVEGLRVAINLDEEWSKLDNGTQFVTGVLVARKAFIEEHPEAVATFLSEYEASINYAKANVAETAPLVVKYGIMGSEPLAKAALPNCNLAFIAGAEMKTVLSGYLGTLNDLNPEAVGGAMPADDFYYVG
ncbi:MAG: ABC transporter substrate-binding protein [Clostridia bacterium]|nr:ABC transporter substrate-binding protein [Clostridia bacterium]